MSPHGHPGWRFRYNIILTEAVRESAYRVFSQLVALGDQAGATIDGVTVPAIRQVGEMTAMSPYGHIIDCTHTCTQVVRRLGPCLARGWVEYRRQEQSQNFSSGKDIITALKRKLPSITSGPGNGEARQHPWNDRTMIAYQDEDKERIEF